VAAVVVLLLAAAAVWCRWVYDQIERYSEQDQAARADAICVFGAAEYDGRPSPVFRARLDHALELYRRGLAPLILTLGGSGGDAYSEGVVGEKYLESRGVPEQTIIAETESRDTEESAARVAVIARTNGLRRLLIVSDGSHLFRIHAILASEGLEVLTSPRPEGAAEARLYRVRRIAHEILSYTLWRLHLR
jgi:uncharacterized SAM-binding protein YcdF (DUF218 family)